MSDQRLPFGTTPLQFQDVTPVRQKRPSWLTPPSSQNAPERVRTVRPRGALDADTPVAWGPASEVPPPEPPEPPPPAPEPEPEPVHVAAPEPEPAPAHEPTIVEPEPFIDPALVDAFERAVGDLLEARRNVLKQSEHQLAELAGLIAQRVVARELLMDRRIVFGLVREGIEALSERDVFRVRVGAAFGPVLAELQSNFAARGQKLEVVVDTALGEHGCVVESDLGAVDESVESRLTALLAVLAPEAV